MTYNLFDVASQVLADEYPQADTERVRSLLLVLDLDPKRAYLKLSNILSLFSGNGNPN